MGRGRPGKRIEKLENMVEKENNDKEMEGVEEVLVQELQRKIKIVKE